RAVRAQHRHRIYGPPEAAQSQGGRTVMTFLFAAISVATLLPGGITDRWSACARDVAHCTEARTFLSELQRAIASDDRERVAGLVHIPLRVPFQNTRLRTKQEFLAKYNDLFPPDTKRAVADQKAEDLFVNWRG